MTPVNFLKPNSKVSIIRSKSRIVVAAADLAPVVQEAVALHLQKFGLLLVHKMHSRHLGPRHELKVHTRDPEGRRRAESLECREQIRVFL